MTKNTEQPNKTAAQDRPVEAPKAEVGTAASAGPNKPAAPVPAKRPLGTKEVIPFEWKLIGSADGLTLTLFKSVERTDVDAQHERLRREGYYGNLRVLGNKEKVKQGKKAKALLFAKAEEKPSAAKTPSAPAPQSTPVKLGARKSGPKEKVTKSAKKATTKKVTTKKAAAKKAATKKAATKKVGKKKAKTTTTAKKAKVVKKPKTVAKPKAKSTKKTTKKKTKKKSK